MAWALAGGFLGFALLATLNSGGYRYGAADQAFYIPAILHQLDPALYPRDWPMIGAQGRYFLLDEIMAGLVRATGVAAATAVPGGADRHRWPRCSPARCWLGRAVLTTPVGDRSLGRRADAAASHRPALAPIPSRGTSTRGSSSAASGWSSLALVLRGRPWWALGLTLASGALHPTTAACFAVIVATAIVVTRPAARLPLAAAAVAAVGAVAVWTSRGQSPFDLTVMDADWRALVATKDYTFPTAWPIDAWAFNLIGPVVLVGAMASRRRAGLIRPRSAA